MLLQNTVFQEMEIHLCHVFYQMWMSFLRSISCIRLQTLQLACPERSVPGSPGRPSLGRPGRLAFLFLRSLRSFLEGGHSFWLQKKWWILIKRLEVDCQTRSKGLGIARNHDFPGSGRYAHRRNTVPWIRSAADPKIQSTFCKAVLSW